MKNDLIDALDVVIEDLPVKRGRPKGSKKDISSLRPIGITEQILRTEVGEEVVSLTDDTSAKSACIQSIAGRYGIKIQTTVARILTEKDELKKAIIFKVLEKNSLPNRSENEK